LPTKASASQIASLKPRKREYEVGVAEHRGLIVTVYPSGARAFSLRFRQDGILKRIRLDATTLSEARAAWLKHRQDLRRGEDPAAKVRLARVEKQLKRQADRSAPTIESLAIEFVELYSKRQKKSWRADELMLKSAVLPEWGLIQARELKRRDVIQLLDRIAGRTPVRANRVLAVVRKMFAWAVERDVLEVSPCLGIKRPGAEQSRSRVLADCEIKVFWNGLVGSGIPTSTQLALRFQLATAQRIGEVVGAVWSEIDRSKGEWLVPSERTKNSRANLVPLSPLAASLIGEICLGPSDFVFPATRRAAALRIDVVTHHLGDVIARLGMAHFTSHDLRRTAATKLAELGTPRVVIDAILNHKDPTVGAIYDRHDYAKEKREALDAWAKRLKNIAAS